MRKSTSIFILAILIVLFANLPRIMKKRPGIDYFSAHSAPDDVWNQYFYIRKALSPTENQKAARGLLDTQRVTCSVYFSFAIASLALVDSNFAGEAHKMLNRLLRETAASLQDRKVNQTEKILDFIHLSLGYNLYEFVTGDTLFHSEGKRLTRRLYTKARDISLSGPRTSHSLPNWTREALVFNFHLFDRIYGTDLANNSLKWLSPFRGSTVNDTIADDFYQTLLFLSGPRPDLARRLFQEHFNFNSFWSSVTEKEPLPEQALWALAAAHAVQDTVNFSRLWRAIRVRGKPGYQNSHLVYENFDLRKNILLLLAKVCRFTDLIHRKPPVLREAQ